MALPKQCNRNKQDIYNNYLALKNGGGGTSSSLKIKTISTVTDAISFVDNIFTIDLHDYNIELSKVRAIVYSLGYGYISDLQEVGGYKYHVQGYANQGITIGDNGVVSSLLENDNTSYFKGFSNVSGEYIIIGDREMSINIPDEIIKIKGSVNLLNVTILYV